MLTYMRNKLVSIETPAENIFVAYGFLDDRVASSSPSLSAASSICCCAILNGLK